VISFFSCSVTGPVTKRNTMESNPCLPLVFFLIVSCSIAQIEAGMRQSEALGHLYKAKLEGNSNIDSALFQAIDHVDISKFHRQEGSKEKDRIESLPGQPKVEFSQYGGYVTVDKSAGRALYYYFVEAQHSKESSPLLLWLNGGTYLYLILWYFLSRSMFLFLFRFNPTLLCNI
jgi:serine carboxypeptidase-like clade 2